MAPETIDCTRPVVVVLNFACHVVKRSSSSLETTRTAVHHKFPQTKKDLEHHHSSAVEYRTDTT